MEAIANGYIFCFCGHSDAGGAGAIMHGGGDERAVATETVAAATTAAAPAAAGFAVGEVVLFS